MTINIPGRYKLLQDWSSRGSRSIKQFSKGDIIDISQIDVGGRKVIGPALLDWARQDLPVEPAKELKNG